MERDGEGLVIWSCMHLKKSPVKLFFFIVENLDDREKYEDENEKPIISPLLFTFWCKSQFFLYF